MQPDLVTGGRFPASPFCPPAASDNSIAAGSRTGHDAAMPRRPARLAATLAAVEPAVIASVTAIAATLQAAQLRLRPAQIRRKAVGDFVTAIDLRAERRLRQTLERLLPDAGFLGEETAPAELDREWLWVVDPIDGTSNFARGLPHFAVAVALLYRSDPVLAVVHCFPDQACLVARRGAGTRRRRGGGTSFRPVRPPTGRLDDGAMLGAQWHRGQQQMAFLAALQRRGGRIRTLGSSVTQLVDVALGRLDANVQQQGRIWDLAAAGLLVEEAGARFTDWNGKPVLPFRDLAVEHSPSIAAAANIHRAVCRLLDGHSPLLLP